MSRTAPALVEADAIELVPPVNSPEYLDEILAICRKHDVGMVLSLNDLELPLLAAGKQKFAAQGTIALVPSLEIVDLCFDKWTMFQQFEAWSIPTPRTFCGLDAALQAFRNGELSFPVIVKPRWGTASIAIEQAFDVDELRLVYSLTEKRIARSIIAEVGSHDPCSSVLVQARIEGQEYGLDIVNNLEGDFVGALARKKLAMRAGETDKALTVEAPDLVRLARLISSHTRHPGLIDCDVFETDKGPIVLELNARFGGGYPFSQIAGADVPRALVEWLNGNRGADLVKLRPGVASAKSDGLVRTDRS